MSAITIAHVVGAIRSVTGKPLPTGVTIDGETRFEDIGLDSLDCVEIVLQIESGIGQSLPDDIESAETIGEFLRIANDDGEDDA